MKNINLSLTLAGLWILTKMFLFYLESSNQELIGVFINILFILLITLGAIYQKVAKEKKLDTYGTNFKLCLRQAGIYIIIVTAYVFVHFKYVNPAYLEGRKNERIQHTINTLPSEDKFTGTLAGKTREEVIEEVKGNFEIFGSVTMNTSIYFLGLFFISIIYSILSPILYKKVILRM